MAFQRIVVGVDFSTASLNAVRWVAGQFAPQARVFVVHVVTAPRTPAFLRGERVPRAAPAQPEASLYPGLRVFADLAGAARSDVEIRTGSPSAELARVAMEVDADLVCVGRTRKRRGSGRFGATTPQRLLSRTNIPVLIVPDTARLLPGAVLAAVSGGTDGREVLRAAGRLAAKWGVRLDALQAIEPEVLAAVDGSIAADEAHLSLRAREWLSRQAAEVAPPALQVRAIARHGDAGEETIAHAARNEIGLIVTERRTRDGAVEEGGGAFDPGSTTRMITWASSCPVLVLGGSLPNGSRGEAIAAPPRRWQLAPMAQLTVTGGRGSVGGGRPGALRPPRRPTPGGDDAA